VLEDGKQWDSREGATRSRHALCMGGDRMITVQSQWQGKTSRGQSRFAPCLRLRGGELAKAGYKGGDKVDVTANPDGSLTVRKVGNPPPLWLVFCTVDGQPATYQERAETPDFAAQAIKESLPRFAVEVQKVELWHIK
jgi:hypothetical protein